MVNALGAGELLMQCNGLGELCWVKESRPALSSLASTDKTNKSQACLHGKFETSVKISDDQLGWGSGVIAWRFLCVCMVLVQVKSSPNPL